MRVEFGRFVFGGVKPGGLFFPLAHDCIILVQDGCMQLSWRGAFLDGWTMRRWSTGGPYWFRYSPGYIAALVVDDFGEMVQVEEWDR